MVVTLEFDFGHAVPLFDTEDQPRCVACLARVRPPHRGYEAEERTQPKTASDEDSDHDENRHRYEGSNENRSVMQDEERQQSESEEPE